MVIMKRMNREIGANNYIVLTTDENPKYPLTIRYLMGQHKYMDFDVKHYPFRPPLFIGSNFVDFSHGRFGKLQQLYDNFKRYRLFLINNEYEYSISSKDDTCIFCRSLLCYNKKTDWKPIYLFKHVLTQLKHINTFIGNAIKIEALKRNYIYIPEDVFFHIFSFISIPFNEIFILKYIPMCKKV
jgi:hypothetical protein